MRISIEFQTLLHASPDYAIIFKHLNLASGRRALTEVMVWELSKRITNTTDLRNLATLGLRVPGYIIDTNLTNKKEDINEAVLKVMHEWGKDKNDPFIAYAGLSAALKVAGLNSFIHEVLEKDWPEPPSTGTEPAVVPSTNGDSQPDK